MKRKTGKRLLTGVLSLVLIGALTACGQTSEKEESTVSSSAGKETVIESTSEAESEPQTLRIMWWGNQTRADATVAMMEKFEEAHPGVTVEYEFTDWGGYWDKLTTLAVSNNMPDIVQMDIGRLTQYASSDLLVGLDEYIADGTIDLSGANEKVLNSGKYSDVTYAIPTGTNAIALAYRVDVAKEAGVEIPMEMTWSEFLDIAKIVYEKTGWKQNVTAEMRYEDSLRNAGLNFFNEDGSALGFEDPTVFVNLFNRYSDAVKAGYGLDYNQMTSSSQTDCFIKDTWISSVYSNQLESYETDSGCELALVNSIQEDDAKAPSNYLKPTMFWSITKNTENKDLAAEFINWYVNEPEVYDITGIDRGVPIDAEMNEYIAAKLEGASAKCADFVSWISTEGKAGDVILDISPKAAEVRALCTEMSSEVYAGVMTDPEARVRKFMEKANALLKEAVE